MRPYSAFGVVAIHDVMVFVAATDLGAVVPVRQTRTEQRPASFGSAIDAVDRWRARSGLSPRGIGRRDLRRLSAGWWRDDPPCVVRSLTDADHSWKVSTFERGWVRRPSPDSLGCSTPLSSLGSALSMATSVLVCSPTLSVPTASRWSRSRRLSWDAESGEL